MTPPPRYGQDNAPRTWAIGNFPEIRHWLAASADRGFVLHGNRPKILTSVLGPQHQTWVGGSGRHRNSVWRADAEGIPVWVLCSKRGTTYEFEHPGNPYDMSIPREDIDKVLGFLARLYLLMEEVEPVVKYGPIVGVDEDPVLAKAHDGIQAGRRTVS